MKANDILIIGGNKNFEAQSVKKPSGAIILDGMHLADTLICVHCGYIWIPIMGSGKIRGYCNKCSGVTCGRKECNSCYPFEKRLDDYEKGRLKVLK